MTNENWVVAEPGVLLLTGTGYTIEWNGDGAFQTTWRNVKLPRAGSLSEAKNNVSSHMRDVLAMGLEP